MREELSVKRLVLAKRLYLEGVEKSAHEHNYSDHMLAVLDLFLAVETLMGAVVLAMDEQPPEAAGSKGYVGGRPSPEQVSGFQIGDYHKFEQLFNQVVAILRHCDVLGKNEPLFNWGALSRLHKVRNDAQHGARAPHTSDLSELVATGEQFINRVLSTGFFALATCLVEVSLANLVEDQVLREYLKHAEAALQRSDLRVCAFLSRVVFLLGRLKRRYDWWKDREGGRIIDDYDAVLGISRDWGVRPLTDSDTRLLSGIMHQVLKLPHLFDNWLLGLDSVDRDRLAELTPRLYRYPEKMAGLPPSDEIEVLRLLDELISEGDEWTGPHFQTSLSKDDCLWVLDFTTETLLRWQREQRGRFAAVDPKYLKALPKLEGIDGN